MDSVKIIIDCVRQVADVTGNEAAKEVDEKSRLFGPDGLFDSMDLVMLTVDIEQKIFELTGKSISLASEKAMSRTVSPFRSVKLMAAFIDELLDEAA